MIKKILFILAIAALSYAASDSLLKPINDLGYGTWAVRLQSLSMHRGYEGVGDGHSTTLGAKIDYLSPEIAYLSGGFSYIYVEPIFDGGGRYGGDNNGKLLLSNGRVNLFNEAWAKYSFGEIGLTNTCVKAGRQVVNGEVFRADEFRQKPRSLEAVALTTKDIPHTALTVGHAWRLSNWMDNQESWKFNDIRETLRAAYSTHGITWAEAVNTSITNLEIAVYDAYAHDIANIAGGRVKYTLTDTTAINGYYRHETAVGKGADRRSDMIGASVQQKIGGVTLEPGVLSISGNGLLFEETTTGINHPLGSSMMIYSGQFNGGADTYYLKATTKIGKTGLYLLYNYTTHDTTPFEGQELNVVISQPLSDRLTVALKSGVGYLDYNDGRDNTFATDTRLFVTYNF
jgi:hypothetical protein